MKEKVRRALAGRGRKTIPSQGLVPAAVLLLLFEKEGGAYLLFTKRTEEVEYHKGQISFPGGAYEKGDRDLLATALRECAEEIGTRAEDLEVLGRLDDTPTRGSHFLVSPFVAYLPHPYPFKVNRGEIEKLIEVPLSALLDKSRFIEDSQVRQGELLPVYFYLYEDHVIWGATARILKQFLEAVFPEGGDGQH